MNQQLPPVPEAPAVQQIAGPAGFDLLDEVGQGGMGIIYRARDLSFDREVAVKLLQSRFQPDSSQAIRFVEESRISGQLQHPGIPAVHQTGLLPDGRPYLIMKLIKGITLQDLIQKPSNGALTQARQHVIPDHYLSIFESICQTLGYAHAHHVIHRDLKPQNIMVGHFGEVQVMDWGIAKILEQRLSVETKTENFQCDVTPQFVAEGSTGTPSSSLTLDGSVLGTPAYMSPEQASGANASLDARTDVFGLGAILCCMLTGEPPWSGDNPEAIRLAAATGDYGNTFARLDASGAEPDLLALARQCLSHDKNDRPVNGEAVANAIASLRIAAATRIRHAEIERTRATEQARELQQRRYMLLFAGAIIITALLCGISGTTWGLIKANAKEHEALASAHEERSALASESEQRQAAVARESETQAVISFVEEVIVRATRQPGPLQNVKSNVMLREVLEIAHEDIAARFAGKPLIEASICMTFGKSFEFLGDHQAALRLHQRATNLRSQVLGGEDQQTILAILALANNQDYLKQHQAALEGRERAYHVSREHFGENSHVTQMAMNNLASSYERFNRSTEALQLREKVLGLIKEQRGMKDPFTLLGMNNLAVAYLFSGKQDIALKQLLETLELQLIHLGADHHIRLDTRNSLAQCFDVMKQPKLAAVVYDSIYRIRQDKQGVEHPDTLHAGMELAVCLASLGQHQQALALTTAVHPQFEKRYGPDSGETLYCLSIMAARFLDLKRTQQGMQLIETIFQRAGSNEDHLSMVFAMHALQFRHYLAGKDLVRSDESLQRWESRNLPGNENQIELAKAWAQLASQTSDPQSSANALRSMKHLQKAVAADWKNDQLLETSPDFQSLRTRDDFKVLLATLKQSNAKP